MYPVALHIGGLTIHCYGVMAALGFLAAMLLLEFNRSFAKLTKDQCSTLLMIALIAGIAGARIFYVVQFWDNFRGDVWKVIRIDQGGLVFYGGFLLALVSILFYAKRRSLDQMRILDIFAPAMAAAHGFGRIGCFLNGCCFGRATDMFWGVTPPKRTLLEQFAGSAPIHPVQLLEAGENFLLCVLLCFVLRRAKRGVTISCYFISYGILRFFNEMLRGDNVLYFHLTPAQWIGLVLIPAGLGLLLYFLRHGQRA